MVANARNEEITITTGKRREGRVASARITTAEGVDKPPPSEKPSFSISLRLAVSSDAGVRSCITILYVRRSSPMVI